MYTNEFFGACNVLGCEVIGSKEEQRAFLKSIDVEPIIRDLTQILYEDCGAEIWSVALFRDSKSYYNLQCVRTWPGYEP